MHWEAITTLAAKATKVDVGVQLSLQRDADIRNRCAMFWSCWSIWQDKACLSIVTMKTVFPLKEPSTSCFCCNPNIIHLWVCGWKRASNYHPRLSMRLSQYVVREFCNNCCRIFLPQTIFFTDCWWSYWYLQQWADVHRHLMGEPKLHNPRSSTWLEQGSRHQGPDNVQYDQGCAV